MELANVKEERDQARGDLTEGGDRDELLAKAQKDRDAANTKRTKAEIDLAKARVDLMQANSQLLEAIQQKVELSQQLEQWQVSITIIMFINRFHNCSLTVSNIFRWTCRN